MRVNRNRYIGWLVLRSDLHALRDQRFARADSEAEAREMVARLNAQAGVGVLYWAEWWSTSSQLEPASVEIGGES